MSEKPKGPNPTMINQEEGQKAKSGGLDRQIQAKIGQQLRAMYDDVVEQGVPDRFAELLKRLDNSGDKPNPDDQESRS